MLNGHCVRANMKTARQRMIVVYCCYACHLVNAVHYSSIADHPCRLSVGSIVVLLLTMYVAIADRTLVIRLSARIQLFSSFFCVSINNIIHSWLSA